MNNRDEEQIDDYRSFLLLEEISKNQSVTQRDLSKKLGVALGLVNSYLKNLASRGYITVSNIPRQRYKYYLTPHGFVEKTRLAYRHLQNFTNLYRMARKDFHTLFEQMHSSGVRKVAFCGVDEVAEIAYLSLKESGLELSGVVDDKWVGKRFFGCEILPVSGAGALDCEAIIITSFQGATSLKDALVKAGVAEGMVRDVSEGVNNGRGGRHS